MKKTRTRFLLIWLALSFVLFFLFWGWISCNNDPVYKTVTVNETQARVYVTRTGDHYHSGGCSYLHSSKIAMGRQEAIDSGYSRCSRCGGASSGTIQVSYKKKVEVDPTSRNIWGSIALGVLSALLPAIAIAAKIEENQPAPANTNVTTSTTPPPKVDKREEQIRSLKNHSLSQLQNLLNCKVRHSKFGVGTIVEIDHDYMKIKFSSIEETKQFQYPQAFVDGFLQLID